MFVCLKLKFNEYLRISITINVLVIFFNINECIIINNILNEIEYSSTFSNIFKINKTPTG